MKAKSINTIENILNQKKEAAFLNFNNLKCNLEHKYNTKLLDNVITDTEKATLIGLKYDFDSLNELYKDFENHQW